MTVEDLFKKIGAQTMEIDALKLEIDRLVTIIKELQEKQQEESPKRDSEKKSK